MACGTRAYGGRPQTARNRRFAGLSPQSVELAEDIVEQLTDAYITIEEQVGRLGNDFELREQVYASYEKLKTAKADIHEAAIYIIRAVEGM